MNFSLKRVVFTLTIKTASFCCFASDILANSDKDPGEAMKANKKQ
jgi:hypothetical protein